MAGLDVSAAVCAGRTKLMFDRRKAARAKGLCYSCPLLEACLDEALRAERHMPAGWRWGVAGGLTPAERWALEKTYDFEAPPPAVEYVQPDGSSRRCRTCLRVLDVRRKRGRGSGNVRFYCSDACNTFAYELRKGPAAKPVRVCAAPGCTEWVYQPPTGRPRLFCGDKCRRAARTVREATPKAAAA